jgi:hypothetical protein
MCPSPLHRHASEASTPAPAACRRFGPEGSTPEVLFHPRGFSPPRWVPPLHPLRACCIPLPILGFAAFPCLALRSKTGPRDTSPRRRTYPSKNSPSTAVPRHRVRCTPCRSLRITAASRQGPLLESCSEVVGGSGAPASRPCSVIGSGTPRRRCRRREIRSFLGFVPLQGSLLATGASAPPSSRPPLAARRRSAAGKLRFAPRWESATAEAGPSPVGAPSTAEATEVRTTPVRQVPGSTEAHDPRTAAVGESPSQPAEACWRGARERETAEAVRDPTRDESLRRFTARVVHCTAHPPCGGGGSLPFHRSGERRTSMPSKSIRS